jgi:peptidoglycan/xylan/chitin deacetylase (PgdA/CDA1 family)
LAALVGGLAAACTVPEHVAEDPPVTRPAVVRATPRRNPTATPVARDARGDILARYRQSPPGIFGLTVPGVLTRLPTSDNVVAITLDACGGPRGSGYDARLIDLLRANSMPATLFLNSRWIRANRAAFGQLAADPLFEIGNHGTRHLPLSVCGRSAYSIPGTRDADEVYDEVAGNRDLLNQLLGKPPRFFRSGTAHYDEVAVHIVADLGEQAVGFEVNGDEGATLHPDQVAHAVLGARPGSIVISHLNHPEGGAAAGWASVIPKLRDRGVRFVHVSDYVS